jgi:hypothetical protein
MSLWRRAFRLFVDDAAFATAALAWIGFSVALGRDGVAQHAVGVTLAAGLLALFAGGVARAARARRF